MTPEQIDTFKANEKELFCTAKRGIIHVKTAPWHEGEQQFGRVFGWELDAGRHTVWTPREPLEVIDSYPSLDAMLEKWIGD